MKLIFFMQINIKVSYKLISTLLATKLHLQGDTIIIDGPDQAFSKYSNNQVRYISKKKLRMELIFCMQINIKVSSTSWHYCF